MKHLVIVTSDAGAVGKSTVTQLLNKYYRNLDMESIIVNTDYTSEDWVENAVFWDLDNIQDANKLVELLDEHDVVIMDIFSGGMSSFVEFYEQCQLNELMTDIETSISVVIPTNGSERANDQVLEVAEAFYDNVNYVVFETPTEVDGKKIFYRDSNAYKAMKFFKCGEVVIPEAPDEVIDFLVSEKVNLPFILEDIDSLENLKVKSDIEGWIVDCEKNMSNELEHILQMEPKGLDEVVL